MNAPITNVQDRIKFLFCRFLRHVNDYDLRQIVLFAFITMSREQRKIFLQEAAMYEQELDKTIDELKM